MKQEILIKLIEKLIDSENKHNSDTTEKVISDHKVGDYVIVRSYYSGAIYGKYMGRNEDGIILHESRRLRYWHAKSGISLSGVAEYGIKEDSKITNPINICITDNTVCEILKCSKECIETFNKQPIYKPQQNENN